MQLAKVYKNICVFTASTLGRWEENMQFIQYKKVQTLINYSLTTGLRSKIKVTVYLYVLLHIGF